MTEERIKIDVYNWGPCVVRLKIKEEFRKLLMKEGKNNRKDFRDKLAGIIENETGYSDESKQKLLPMLSQYLGVYDQAYQRYVQKHVREMAVAVGKKPISMKYMPDMSKHFHHGTDKTLKKVNKEIKY